MVEDKEPQPSSGHSSETGLRSAPATILMRESRPFQVLTAVSAVAIIAAVWGWSAAGHRAEERDQARNHAIAVEQQLARATDTTTSVTQNLNQSKASLEAAKQDIAKLTQEAQTANRDLQALGAQLTATTAERDRIRADRSALMDERNAVFVKLSNLEHLTGERETVQTRLTQLQAELKAAQDQLATIQTQRGELGMQVQQAEQTLGDLQGKVQQAERRTQELQRVTKDTEQRFAEVHQQTEDLRNQQSTLAQQAKEATDLMAQRSQDLDQVQKELADLRSQEAATRETLTGLQRKAQASTEAVAAAEKRLADLQLATTQATGNLSRITANIAEQSNTLAGTRDQYATAAKQIDEANQTRTALLNQINGLSQQLAGLQEETWKQQEALQQSADLQAKIEQLTMEINRLQAARANVTPAEIKGDSGQEPPNRTATQDSGSSSGQ